VDADDLSVKDRNRWQRTLSKRPSSNSFRPQPTSFHAAAVRCRQLSPLPHPVSGSRLHAEFAASASKKEGCAMSPGAERCNPTCGEGLTPPPSPLPVDRRFDGRLDPMPRRILFTRRSIFVSPRHYRGHRGGVFAGGVGPADGEPTNGAAAPPHVRCGSGCRRRRWQQRRNRATRRRCANCRWRIPVGC
jgi:hypothetical protein